METPELSVQEEKVNVKKENEPTPNTPSNSFIPHINNISIEKSDPITYNVSKSEMYYIDKLYEIKDNVKDNIPLSDELKRTWNHFIDIFESIKVRDLMIPSSASLKKKRRKPIKVNPAHNKRLLLVDMDETLLHSEFHPNHV